jgi:hypothetical protein
MKKLKELHSEINKNDMTPVSLPSDETATKEDHFIPNIILADETAILIFSFLDVKSQYFASLVSRHWNRLADDQLLWKSQLKQYTQGQLWRYLFQTSDISVCQKYFAEILFESNIDCNNFIEIMAPIKEKLLERIHAVFTRKRMIALENYLHQIDITKLNNNLFCVLEIIQGLPVKERETIISCDFQSFSKKYQKEIMGLLLKIHLIEIHLTDLILLNKLVFPRADQFEKFLLLPVNKFISGSAIRVTLSIAQLHTLEKFTTLFKEFLYRFNERELVNCAQCSSLVASTILIYPRTLSLLSDDSLIKIFNQMNTYNLEEVFCQLMNHSPMLVKRLNADLLVRLVNYKKRKFISIPTIILNYSILINRLQEDQCVEIISNRREKLYITDAIKILQSQSFKEYALKLKNPRTFLLQENLLCAMFAIDWISEILTPEDALQASKESLLTAEKIAMNKVWLNKFSHAQLLELAIRHKSIALVLLKNKDLNQRWKEHDFNVLRQEYAYSENCDDLEDAIEEVKSKRVKKQVRFAIPQDAESRTARNMIRFNRRYQNSYTTTVCRLDTHHPKKQPSQQVISTSKLLNTMNNWSPAPAQRHQVKEMTRQSNNSIFWSATSLLGIGLLLAAGILLCATGGGVLAGVPFIVSAVTFLPVSIEIVGAACLLAGTFLSLIGLNLANEHSTKLIKPIITLAKESLKKTLTEPVPSFFTPYKKYKPAFDSVAKLSLKPGNKKIIYSDENYEDNNFSFSRCSNR